MHAGISKRARAYVRRRATAGMLSTCQIERVGGVSWDGTTNLVTAGERTIIYEGPCRIWEVSGGGPFTVADDDNTILQTTNLSIPWDTEPVPEHNDEIVILSSQVDDQMVGKRYRIISSAKTGDLRATRRFVVQGVNKWP
jgi:hypothetical protein